MSAHWRHSAYTHQKHNRTFFITILVGVQGDITETVPGSSGAQQAISSPVTTS